MRPTISAAAGSVALDGLESGQTLRRRRRGSFESESEDEMTTLIATFESDAPAVDACRALLNAGFAQDELRLLHGSDSGSDPMAVVKE